MHLLLPAVIAVFAIGVLIFADVAADFGAHPWWSRKTLMIGTPIGLVLALLSPMLLRPLPRFVAFLIATALAFGVARYGQTQFAASYAEDALAGKLWYFGWIATGATLAATLFTGLQLIAKRR